MRKLLDLFRSKDPVAERLTWLRANGRIIEGVITELFGADGEPVNPASVPASPCYARYEYTIRNVTYESTHELDADQLRRIGLYLPGMPISVRYDPRSPTSSILE